MFTKTIRDGSENKTLFCYDKVPENQPVEMQVVFNSCLKTANDFIEYAYNRYISILLIYYIKNAII